jgi:hypothetical protein
VVAQGILEKRCDLIQCRCLGSALLLFPFPRLVQFPELVPNIGVALCFL